MGLYGEERRGDYLERLSKIGVDRVLAELRQVDSDKPLVLCCYEKARENDCHRFDFSDFWLAFTGELVGELLPLEQLTLGVGIQVPETYDEAIRKAMRRKR